MASYSFQTITVYPHHLKQDICGTRAKYRDGKKDRAVKVYTVNQESVYLLISNVPSVGGADELQALCDQYGIVSDIRILDEYPCEEFTEAYLVKYASFPSARNAKKQLDDKTFLGSPLHVCYAPEFESTSEVATKLEERRKFIAWKTNSGRNISTPKQNQGSTSHEPTDSVLQPVTYVWAGKEYTVYPEATPAPQIQNVVIKDKRKSDTSYENTIAHIGKKVAKVSVPNMRVGFKRRKRI